MGEITLDIIRASLQIALTQKRLHRVVVGGELWVLRQQSALREIDGALVRLKEVKVDV